MRHNPRRILYALVAILIAGIIGICRDADMRAQKTSPNRKPSSTQQVSPTQKTTHSKQKDEYHRPDPIEPLKPKIPGTNRYQQDKVFLEQADSIIKVPDSFRDFQIVKGNVKFRQMGTWMYCDSAYYFPEENSLDAFGHVKMTQGDTLKVFSDKLYYDGTSRFARLRCGPSEPTVRLINRKTSLTTDSLDYSLMRDVGWYATGGTLKDEMNTLTSVYGQYSPATKDAEFFQDVILVGNRNDFEMYSDTLYYNTASKLARIVSPTRIITTEDEILTSDGIYNTGSGFAELTSRSTIYHTDSLMRTTTLEGDSIVYDPETRISRAYQFRDRFKKNHPVVITDTARKAVLIGGFGLYNDMTREAMATEYPLLMEYSRGDTLFLRADTILTRMIPYPAPKPPVDPEIIDQLNENQASDSIAEAENIILPNDSIADVENIIVDNDSIAISENIILNNDSIADVENIVVANDSISEAEKIIIAPDSIASKEIIEPQRQPTPPQAGNPPTNASDSTWHYAKAWPRARFFRKDIQGVADTIIFTELDSLLRMKRLPVAWNQKRQVRGDTIIIHLNDSTADWARIPSHARIMEHVEEDYFNQLHSDKMIMWFSDSTLRRLEAEGSVETIMLPQEQDSTFNRLVSAESSYLTVDMTEKGDIDRLKMWPEVSGTVTPLFLVKKSQKLLPGARWLEAIRPKMEWYEGRLRWADDLGELPPELEDYFNEN